MGQVVRLKVPKTTVTESMIDRAMRTIDRQKKTIAELRAKNRALIKFLNDPFDDVARLRRELMRMQDEVNERLHGRCTCTPDRADFLRAIAREVDQDE